MLHGWEVNRRATIPSRPADRGPGRAEQADRCRAELRRSHRGDEAHAARHAADLVQGADIAAAARRHDRDRVSGASDALRSRARHRDRPRGEERRASTPRSTTSLATRLAKTSATAISKPRRSSSRAPSHSTPTRRSGRLFTPMSMSQICRSHCGKTASRDSRRGRTK